MMLINPYIIKPAGSPGSLPAQFLPTGNEVLYVVPAGVTAIKAHCIGAAGGGGSYTTGTPSGAGGYSVGTIAVTPGETLKVRTGTGGQGGQRTPTPKGGNGGYPGGGTGAFGDVWAGGGGGYSGVFRNDGTPLLIAGGGGGSSGYSSPGGGNGGGLTGADGRAAGTGGTQTNGGASSIYPGTPYQGGNADSGNQTVSTSNDGGGGGSGYWGGGGYSGDAYSGGGGSGYIGGATSANTYRHATSGTRPSEIPSTIAGFATGTYGTGVASVASGNAANGSDGLIVFETP